MSRTPTTRTETTWLRTSMLALVVALVMTGSNLPGVDVVIAAEETASPSSEPAATDPGEETEVSPEPEPTPEPTEGPTSEPEPTPEPTPEPEPSSEPAPSAPPEPDRSGDPDPSAPPASEPPASPAPEVSPEPGSSPGSEPETSPEPAVSPGPQPTCEPGTDGPTGSGDPCAPEPAPSTAPEPTPVPTIEPVPEPTEVFVDFPEIVSDEAPAGVEIVELRTEDSQTYLHEDGSYVTELFSRPVFYRPDGSDALEPIEVGFRDVAASDAVVSDRAPTNVEARAADDADGFLAIEHDGRTIEFALPASVLADVAAAEPATIEPETSGPEATAGVPAPPAPAAVTDRALRIRSDGRFVEYPDVYPSGADLRVFPAASGAKTFIVLPDGSEDRFTFLVDAPGLDLVERADGSIGFVAEEGVIAGVIPRPFLVDSSTDVEGRGSGRYSEDVTLELDPRADRWAVTIVVDQDFLDGATYPVYVDPTTTFPFDEGTAGDTFASQKNPSTNFNTYQRPDSPYYHEMWLGEAPGDPGEQNRVFLKFTGLDPIIGDAHVTDAELRFLAYHQYSADKNTWLKRITEGWNPGSVTWNAQPGVTSVAFGDDKKVQTSAGTTAVFEVGKTVQKWASDTWSNYGFRLDENGKNQTHWKRLIADEEGGTDVPRLRVTWHRPVATAIDPTGGAATASRALTWSYADNWAGGDPDQSHFHAQVASDSSCSTVLTDGDSGEIASSATTWSFPSSVNLTDFTTYYWCVRVKDGTGWSDWTSASFEWDSNALTADIADPADDGAVGASVDITGTAAGTGFSQYTLRYQSSCTPGGTLVDIGTNPYTTAVSNDVLATWDTSSLTEGDYLVELSVAATPDPLTDTICVSVDHTDPTASLETAPLSSVAPIEGTADDADFDLYTLEYAEGADATSGFADLPGFVPSESVAVTSTGVLAEWDTLEPDPNLQGTFTIRLTVRDRAGNETVVEQNVFIENDLRGLDSVATRVPIEMAGGWTATLAPATGEATVSRQLFLIPSYGPPQQLALAYSSFEEDDSGFGDGWSSTLTQDLTIEDGLVVWRTADGSLVPFTELSGGWTGLPSRFETLTHQAGASTFTIESPDGSELVFEDSGDGRLLSVVDRFGQSLDLTWSASSATATDDSGRTTTLTINGSGRIAEAEDSAGREWDFAYSGGQLVTVTDPEGVDTDLTYGTDGLETVSMTRTHSGAADTIEWEIDYGALSTVESFGPGSDPTRFSVSYEGGQSTLDDPDGETRYGVSDASLVDEINEPEQVSTTLTWDEEGRTRLLESVTETTGSGEVTTSYTYDEVSGQLLTEEAPTKANTRVITTYDYDANNDLVTIERAKTTAPGTPLDGTVTNTYNASRERTSMTEDDGGLDLTTIYTYTGKHLLETEEAPDGVITKYEYDSHGNRTAMVVNFKSGESATASRNVRTEYEYDGSTTAGKAGLVTTETDPLGRETRYEYDDLGRLTKTVRNHDTGSSDSDANLTSEILYDEIGWVEATIDERGTVTRLVTDHFGRTTKRIGNCTDSGTTPSPNPRTCVGGGTSDWKTNIVTDSVYDAAGNLTSETVRGATDVKTTYTYDGLGRQLTMTLDPSGLDLTTTFAYDEQGNDIAVQDPRGTVTRNFYDEAGNLTKEIENCSSTAKVIPDPIEDCTGGGTANAVWNRVTEYEYDELGRLKTETAPNGRITKYLYDGMGWVTKRIDNDVAGTPSGNEDLDTTYAYDEMGRTTAVRVPTSNRTTFAVTGTVYDALGRVTKTIESCTDSGTTVPGANVACTGSGTQDVVTNLETSFTYDAMGNQVSMTTPDPSAPASGTGWLDTVVTRFAYDGADRLCRVLEHAGTDLQSLADPCTTAVSGTTSSDLSTRYEYDENGNLTEMIDAAGETQSYGYDRLGRMTSRTDGLAETISWRYDERGNRTTQVDRESAPSISVSWVYDKADRMTSRTADSATVDYTYDDAGDLLTASGPTGTITVSRNQIGGITLVEPDDGSADTSYGYGLVTGSREDASGEYEFVLDEWGRETKITSPLHSNKFKLEYRPDGQRSEREDPNGMVHTYTYDVAGRLTDIVSDGSGCSGASCADISYTYDRAGMRLSEDSSIDTDAANGTAAFEYDATGRLIDYDAPGSHDDQSYGWSEVLDRESLTVDTTTVTTTFDAAHRPTSDSAGGSYSHDDDGRLTARPGQVLEWDSLGRLTTVKDGSNNVISSYTYDALDRLREITSGGVTIRHRYVGITTQVSQTRDVTNTTNLRKFVNSNAGETLARFTTPSTGRRYYGFNGHGDLVWTAKGNETVDKTVRFDPWGQAIEAPTTRPDFGFQGSWLDTATDLYWVIARWYAPELGRFISEDELLGEPVNPRSRHLYAYGGGDPVGKVDADGRLYKQAKRVSWYRHMSYRKGVTGKLKFVVYIPGKETWVPPWAFRGDNRGPSRRGNCRRARVCVIANFDSASIRFIVQPSCRRAIWNNRIRCWNARPLGRGSNMWILQDTKNVLKIRYQATDSAIGDPLGFSVDGVITVVPRVGIKVRRDQWPAMEVRTIRGDRVYNNGDIKSKGTFADLFQLVTPRTSVLPWR